MSARTLPKPIQACLPDRKQLTEALFQRPESLSALLPYNELLPEKNLFVNKDGSLGAVFEVELLEHETMTEAEIVKAVQSLKSWFNLPENCTLQILFDQSAFSPLDAQLDQIHSQYPNSHPVSKKLFERRFQRLKTKCSNRKTPGPFRRRIYVSIKTYPKNKKAFSLKDVTARGGKVLHSEMKSFVDEMRSFSHLVQDFQANSRIKLKPLGAEELLDFLRRFFNPETYYKRSFAKYNSNLPLSEQFVFNSPVLDHAGIEREGVKTRTLSLKTSPQFAYPGGVCYFLKLKFPFKISLNFSFPSKTKVKRFFDLKEFFLENTPSAKAKRQREEVLEVQDRLAREDRCLQMTFNILIEGKTDQELDDKTRQVINIFHSELDCEAITDGDIGTGLALNCLPLCYSPDSDLSAARFIRILRSDALNFIPIFDSFRGLKNPLQLYLSREDNIVPFNLLENETSNHTCVLADTGSGKSAFVIDCIQAVKRLDPEPVVFIIDKKSSYTMLSEYFDADLTVFDRNKDIPFSPFRGVYDEEKIAFLTQLISSAVQLSSPSYKLESEHQAAITKALKQAYVKKQKRAGLQYLEGELIKKSTEANVILSMEDFISELGALPEASSEAFREMAESLIHKLRPFYGDGTYARFFSARTPQSNQTSNRFFAYDLDALDSDPVLQSLMTMAVFEEIRMTMALAENQGRAAFIVLEEFAMLGRDNPVFQKYVTDFAETARKKGWWLISLSPRPQNFFDLPTGRALWSTASNYIFLEMSADNIDYIAKQSSILDQATIEIVKSLRTVRGKHADIFYTNKKKTKSGAFRYQQTDYDAWLAPTNALSAYEADLALKKFQGQKWDALDYLVKKFPNGVVVKPSEEV